MFSRGRNKAAAEQTVPIEGTGEVRRKGVWRRRIANLLILAGLAVLLYPVGTWAYTWYQQAELKNELNRAHPGLAGDSEEFFADGMVTFTRDLNEDLANLRAERADLRQAAEVVRDEAEAQQLFERAKKFAKEVRDQGGLPIGRLIVPSIGLESVLIQGADTSDLREGPGHWPETPLPGLGGNFVVSGHRTTYGAPFFKLDKVAEGDEIQVLMPYVAAQYRVTRTVIVSPDEVEVVAQRGLEEISLATCHPIYSARQRLVVQAELVGFKLLGS